MDFKKISELFNLQYPFDKIQLKNSLHKKINNIKSNPDIDINDKKILIDNYYKNYKIAQQYIDNGAQNINNKVGGYSLTSLSSKDLGGLTSDIVVKYRIK